MVPWWVVGTCSNLKIDISWFSIHMCISKYKIHNFTRTRFYIILHNFLDMFHNTGYHMNINFLLIPGLFVYGENLGCALCSFWQTIINHQSILIAFSFFGRRPSCNCFVMWYKILYELCTSILFIRNSSLFQNPTRAALIIRIWICWCACVSFGFWLSNPWIHPPKCSKCSRYTRRIGVKTNT